MDNIEEQIKISNELSRMYDLEERWTADDRSHVHWLRSEQKRLMQEWRDALEAKRKTINA